MLAISLAVASLQPLFAPSRTRALTFLASVINLSFKISLSKQP